MQPSWARDGGDTMPLQCVKGTGVPKPPADFGQGYTSAPGVIWRQSLISPTFPTVGLLWPKLAREGVCLLVLLVGQ